MQRFAATRWRSVRASTSGTEPDEYDWPESRRSPVPSCTRLNVAIDGTYVRSNLDTGLYGGRVLFMLKLAVSLRRCHKYAGNSLIEWSSGFGTRVAQLRRRSLRKSLKYR